MSYWALVLGVTIQILFCLRYYSVSGYVFGESDMSRLPFVSPHSEEEFQESIKFSPIVFEWLSGQKSYFLETFILRILNPKTPEEEEQLKTFLSRDRQRFMPNSKTLNDESGNREKSPFFDSEHLCPSLGDEYDVLLKEKREREHNAESQRSRNCNPETGAEITPEYLTTTGEYETTAKNLVEPPEGCQYTNDKRDEMICSGANIKDVPQQLPSILTTFELSNTDVIQISNNSFQEIHLQNLRLNHNEITKVDPFAFQGVTGLKYVEIKYNKLCWIWFEYIFGLEETEILILETNKIFLDRQTPEKPVEEYEPTLRSLKLLSLNANPLGAIPEMFFASLRFSPVGLLSLKHCELYYIHPEALKHLHKLIILDLSENPSLMPNITLALHGLQNISLETLTIAENSLREIPKAALNYVKDSLKVLDLSGNNFLNTITRSSFPDSMPKMDAINLNNCQISTIGIASFEGMPNLTTVELGSNRLRVVPPAISMLTKLINLDLSNQDTNDNLGRPQRFEILPNTFKSLNRLRVLMINAVKLDLLHKDTFKGLTALNMLVLSHTNLAELEDFTFDGLRTLRTLDLKNNPLQSVNSNTFFGLGNLQNLILESCELSIPFDERLKDIPTVEFNMVLNKTKNPIEVFDGRLVVQRPVIDFATVGHSIADMVRASSGDTEPPVGSKSEPFKYLQRLQYLKLQKNKIQRLSPKLFEALGYLHYLDLSENVVEQWNDRVFENNTVLEQLLLPFNRLFTANYAMLEDFRNMNWKPVLDLSRNPFVCDVGTCRLIAEVINGSIILQEFVTNDRYTCSVPPSYDKYQLWSLNDTYCVDVTGNVPTTTAQTPPVTNSRDWDPPGDTGMESSVLITIAIIGSCSVLLIAGAIFSYKKRMHLKYFWFSTKLNFKRMPRSGSRSSNLISEGLDFDVFISYSHHDSDFIQDSLVPELEGRGKLMDSSRNEVIVQMDKSGGGGDMGADSLFKVCLHERDFEVGTPITENIIECVDRSRKVIVVVSKNYLESQWCLYEMNLAYHRLVESRRKSFVVLFLEEVPVEMRTKVLNYLMRSRTYIQWPGNEATTSEKKLFWVRLKTSLASED